MLTFQRREAGLISTKTVKLEYFEVCLGSHTHSAELLHVCICKSLRLFEDGTDTGLCGKMHFSVCVWT